MSETLEQVVLALPCDGATTLAIIGALKEAGLAGAHIIPGADAVVTAEGFEAAVEAVSRVRLDPEGNSHFSGYLRAVARAALEACGMEFKWDRPLLDAANAAARAMNRIRETNDYAGFADAHDALAAAIKEERER